MQIQSSIELYETDGPKIREVVARLRGHVGTVRSKEDMVREVMGRFAEAGYLADVAVGTEVVGTGELYHFEITLSGRTDLEGEYDHERQRHEVRSSALGAAGPVAMPGAGALWTPKGSG